MTWVIGAASLFSRAALISDVRVRFQDGTTADMLQKAYPIGNYVAAGFAGSVRIGFELISSLRNLLPPQLIAGGYACDPVEVVNAWVPYAKEIFRQASQAERSLNAHILLVGASPTENMGSPQFPKIHLIRMVAPHFVPGFFNQGLRMCSIGTGAQVADYKRALRPLFRNSSGVHQAHMVGIHHWAHTLGHCVSTTVRDSMHQGFSASFHIIGLTLGDMAVMTNDMTTYPLNAPPTELTMPQVAQSWDQFDEMAKARARASACAAC